MKFYTEEGIWDLVGNNTPIFFVKDPLLFPSFIHTQKRNPVTHLKDMDMFWDFLSLRPESTHQVMILFSDRGIPDGYPHMNGYGSHTFKLVNNNNEFVYCKFHYKVKIIYFFSKYDFTKNTDHRSYLKAECISSCNGSIFLPLGRLYIFIKVATGILQHGFQNRTEQERYRRIERNCD